MSALDRMLGLLFVPFAGVRTYILLKGTLLLLAFDIWLTRISHGGRYGAGGFNVAHFAWLDAIQPSVSPGLYIAVSMLTAFLCVALALAPRPPRWLFAVTFVLHTWSWAMSMLDSYQHHYLLSIVLLALIFFPRLSAEEALLPPEPKAEPEPAPKKSKRKKAPPPKPAPLFSLRTPTTAGWAYAAFSWSIAIVYAYTAFSKTAETWLSGVAMRSVLKLPPSGEVPADANDPVAPVRVLAGLVGIEGETFWTLLGHSVVLVQIICCAGYLLAPFRDAVRSKLFSAFMWIALLTALSFHLGAEHLQLKIGWFSWYMILFALVMMLPAELLVAPMRALVPLAKRAPAAELLLLRIGGGLVLALVGLVAYVKGYGGIESDALRRFAETFLDPAVLIALGALLFLVTPVRMVLHALDGKGVKPNAALAAVGLGALALTVAGYQIDLPGAPVAGVIASVALGAGTIGLLISKGDARAMHPYGLSAVLGAAAFFLVVWQSDVRFDFWRNVGGDHRRRGEVATAYEAYVKANCYAPPGQDRRRQEREMRERLEAEGRRLPEVDCTLPRSE